MSRAVPASLSFDFDETRTRFAGNEPQGGLRRDLECGDALTMMRFVLACAGISLALGVRALCADTTMFRANPQHSGVYAASGIIQPPHVKWKFKTGGAVISSPAVANGIVYVGSTDGYLYAIDVGTGVLRWKYATRGPVVASPAIDRGSVYVTSYDGRLYAVAADTGKLRWKFETQGERRFEGTHLHGFQPVAEVMPDVFDVYLSSPTVWRHRVYFGSGDGYVYALTSSGSIAWKFKTNDVVHASPAVVDGRAYIGSWDSYFYALDAFNGRQVWRFKTGEDPHIHNQVGIQSSAAVVDGLVFFGCRDSHLYALDAGTGKKRWAFSTHGSWVVSSPAVDDGEVYFSTSDSSLVYQADARTGAARFSLAFQGWPLFSSPAIAGHMLYIGSWAGTLLGIDLKHRRLAWTFATDGARTDAAALTKPDGTPNYEFAYHSSFYDDMVIGFHTMMKTGAVLSSPVVTGNAIYVGSADGNLYALTDRQ